MNIREILRAEYVMPISVLIGALVLLILAGLRKTESRHSVGVFLATTQFYVALFIILLLVFTFLMRFIPGLQHDKRETRKEAYATRCAYIVNNQDREFYRENFSDLLTVFGVFGALCGIGVPFIGILLQRHSLKSEASVLQNSFLTHRRQLVQDQHRLRNQLEEMREEINNAKDVYDRYRVERDILLRTQIDGVRTGMECQLSIYNFSTLSEEQKGLVIKSYYMQFLDFIRLISKVPMAKPYGSDVARFRDAIKIFRKNDTAFQRGLELFSEIMRDNPPTEMPGLRLALSESEYEFLKSELYGFVPSLFVE